MIAPRDLLLQRSGAKMAARLIAARHSTVPPSTRCRSERAWSRVRRKRHAPGKWQKRLARLSRVDGGVLITDHYQLLGFGVEVVAPADELRTATLDDGSKENIEQYGTKHRSAFRLCDCYSQAVAFVCSQDGGIKCVCNERGVVRLRK
jgi:hypothetical protein